MGKWSNEASLGDTCPNFFQAFDFWYGAFPHLEMDFSFMRFVVFLLNLGQILAPTVIFCSEFHVSCSHVDIWPGSW